MGNVCVKIIPFGGKFDSFLEREKPSLMRVKKASVKLGRLESVGYREDPVVLRERRIWLEREALKFQRVMHKGTERSI